MSYQDKEIIKDTKRQPVPQYWNPKTGQYEVIEGEYGANSFLQKGTVVKESWQGTGSGTKTFSKEMFGFGIINDGASDITFTINNQSFLVKVGESFEDLFPSFTKVDISTSSTYRALVRV